MKTQFKVLFVLASWLALALDSPADTHLPLVTAQLSTSPSSACLSNQKAKDEAERLVLQSAQTFCRKEGFSWHAASLESLGRLDCTPCGSGGQVSCSYSQTTLQCRKSDTQFSWNGWFPNLSMK